MVPIRDTETHAVLPTITVGDCGAKMGRNGLDNGWIQFNHTRIPRRNMMMRHAVMTPEGRLERAAKSNEQSSYAALLMGRAMMVCVQFMLYSCWDKQVLVSWLGGVNEP